MTSKFNFKLLPISHLAFHFQNQTPLLPAFFFKNLSFWSNDYKINPPQKILFLLKRKDMCQFRHELTFSFSLWSLPETFHFGTIVTKLTLPPKKSFFYQKRKDMCQFLPRMDVSLIGRKGRMRVRFAKNPIPDMWISDTFLSLNSARRRNWTRHWIASKSSERKSMNIFSIISFLSIF